MWRDARYLKSFHEGLVKRIDMCEVEGTLEAHCQEFWVENV